MTPYYLESGMPRDWLARIGLLSLIITWSFTRLREYRSQKEINRLARTGPHLLVDIGLAGEKMCDPGRLDSLGLPDLSDHGKFC